MNILVVDDAPDMRLILRRALEVQGHQVHLACDGQEAWDLLQTRYFQVVVSDWMMPRMDGPELCRRIRTASFPNYVYIIMMTGKLGKKSLIQGMDAGADDFATKPVNPAELEVRLRAAKRVLDLEKSLEEKNDKLQETNLDLETAQASIQQDLRNAANTQTNLLPAPQNYPGIAIDWYFRPAIYIGGDSFNYYPIGSDLLLFYTLDVSGHGISSALLSISLHTLMGSSNYLYNQSDIERKKLETFPDKIATKLNKIILGYENIDHYFTLFLGVIDLREHLIYSVQAGHPQPFMYRQGELELLNFRGFPVGLLEMASFETEILEYKQGDKLILYTDGINELTDDKGELLETQQLQDFLVPHAASDNATIIQAFKSQFLHEEQLKNQPDDISLLLFEFTA